MSVHLDKIILNIFQLTKGQYQKALTTRVFLHMRQGLKTVLSFKTTFWQQILFYMLLIQVFNPHFGICKATFVFINLHIENAIIFLHFAVQNFAFPDDHISKNKPNNKIRYAKANTK